MCQRSESHCIYRFVAATMQKVAMVLTGMSVTFYREKYCLQRAPVFLCFYAFTAAITHVTTCKYVVIYAWRRVSCDMYKYPSTQTTHRHELG